MHHAIGSMLEADADQHDRDRADRQVDVENPVPGQRVGNHTPEQWAHHATSGKHAGEQALIPPAFPWRNQVADDGLRQRNQAARAQTLHGSEDDQLGHRARQAAQRGPSEKDRNGDKEGRLAPEDIT